MSGSLKEFEKWATNEDMYDRIEARKVWKAALEYAENLFVQLNSFEVEEAINKELRSAKT